MTVIIPVFNASGGLVRSVGSVLGQTYRNLEVILVDDGSTDGSSVTCDQLAEADSRVLVIHQSNGGVSNARNSGLARASGEYLAFVDADDVLRPEALADLIPRLGESKADFACFGMIFVYRDGTHTMSRTVMSIEHEVLLAEGSVFREHFFELFDRNYWSSVCNKVFRTEFLRSHHLKFDSRLAVLEDLEYVVRALTLVPTVIALPQPLYEYSNDLTVQPASRRPSIDYLDSFRILEGNIDSMAEALEMTSEWERARLKAMVFRFYLIGMELQFAHLTDHQELYPALRRYATDCAVIAAAQAAAPSRFGVGMTAAFVRRGRVALLYLALFSAHRMRIAKSALRVRVARAKAFWRR